MPRAPTRAANTRALGSMCGRGLAVSAISSMSKKTAPGSGRSCGMCHVPSTTRTSRRPSRSASHRVVTRASMAGADCTLRPGQQLVRAAPLGVEGRLPAQVALHRLAPAVVRLLDDVVGGVEQPRRAALDGQAGALPRARAPVEDARPGGAEPAERL